MSKKTIVGISAYYHDSAAALIRNGVIEAAIQEERYTRKKHDASFPKNAIIKCMELSNCKPGDIDAVVFYDKPLVKFERLLETYLSYTPRGFRSFLAAMPVWLKEKLYLKTILKKELAEIFKCKVTELPELLFTEHHQSHAASAFFPSPFNSAAVLCMDGVGEWATTSVWQGDGNILKPLWQIDFPHSLGLLYSAFTYYTGFKVNSGEYKLMGLAPYGEPIYSKLIKENLIDIKDDGTFRLDMKYFNYATGLTMTNKKFAALFGKEARKPESEVTQHEMDIAASIQKVTEEIVLLIANTIHKETGNTNLCLAGGVALNCVSNGALIRQGPFENIWIQPASGDAGGAIGSALSVWYEYYGNKRQVNEGKDSMCGAYLGPEYSDPDIKARLDVLGAHYTQLTSDELYDQVSDRLNNEDVIGWFNGRMEFGPRALGGRSIIGDPRSPKMQSVMNLKIKYRESFRPFAPAILEEDIDEVFDLDRPSPYMLVVSDVKKSLRLDTAVQERGLTGVEKLKVPRSTLPAITHVDYSARIQTVSEETNPRFYNLLKWFKQKSGIGVLVNTSFNVRGEPIVCTPEDAYRCFMRTEMDHLVLGHYLLSKPDQPKYLEDGDWRQEYELD